MGISIEPIVSLLITEIPFTYASCHLTIVNICLGFKSFATIFSVKKSMHHLVGTLAVSGNNCHYFSNHSVIILFSKKSLTRTSLANSEIFYRKFSFVDKLF